MSPAIMTQSPRVPDAQPALNFTAVDIEEPLDVYFYRPVGAGVANVARRCGMTPNHVTVLGGLVGMAGGACLFHARWALFGVALLVAHGILDAADGQLARMTGRVSPLGRLLDGLADYFTWAVVYAAIVVSSRGRGGASILVVAALAMLANIAQAQLYDYHRTAYASVVVRNKPPRLDSASPHSSRWARWLTAWYSTIQGLLIGTGAEIAATLARRSVRGCVRDEDRVRYRAAFRRPARRWNVLGDNTRVLALAACALLHHLEWFFLFILVPMTAAAVMLWCSQQRVNRHFLTSLC
jgi:phosphatidylglycerophosphate synthase